MRIGQVQNGAEDSTAPLGLSSSFSRVRSMLYGARRSRRGNEECTYECTYPLLQKLCGLLLSIDIPVAHLVD
jgi:hypothetical protein